ncbi:MULTISPECIES: AMP-binding protein [Odoribacteraceae]|uniref:AMP-binding protein n=1 Tax=Odoribacteraceae TaxID=1853231 RepID=UPI000E4B8651|nr:MULTISPECIES: AMP-binding protein [Odoribacteraceae]MCQ4873912.1 AMP-binding protein [Butyricimonas paravirosa]RHR79745.1 AMP-dependent synthetase [Odoribacter sp. AF15-53]
MLWNIRLNGKRYTSANEIEGQEDETVTNFLKEWYNNEDYVTGHTSGSTGTPKELHLLKRDMIASAELTNRFFHIGTGSNLLLCLSPSYIAGKMMIVRAILSGANLHTVPPSSSPLATLDMPFDLAAMVPMQVETTLKSPSTRQHFTRLRQILIGGAAISSKLEKQLQSFSTNCYATYGMTETVSHVALRPINGPRQNSFYFALGDVHFSQDKRGCLIIHAPHLHEQQFITNDLVILHTQTQFEWLGRVDNVINSGGVKLFPENIEHRLSPLISRRFFITSVPDEYLGQMAVIVIEDTPWPANSQQELLDEARKHLAPYEVPKRIYFMDHFQETYSGKIIRKII